MPNWARCCAAAAHLSEATDGAFDITATPLSRCWRLLQRDGHVPGPEAIAEARARTGITWSRFEGDDGYATGPFDSRALASN